MTGIAGQLGPGTASAPLLQVQRLTFSYAQSHVLSAWSHEFGGGLTWVRGRNGCGKSTLLKLLAGVMPPASGEVRLGAMRLDAQPLDYRRHVFWCGPGALAFEHLTMAEYFAFMRGLYASVDDLALQQHVTGFGIGPFANMPLAAMSTGTQRKVWLAMALSAGTRVVLMDEPFNALDAGSVQHLQGALVHAAHDATRACILVSHEELGPAAAHATELTLPLHPSG